MKAWTRFITAICSTGLLVAGLSATANAFPVLRIIHDDLPGGMIEVTDDDEDGIVDYMGSFGGFAMSMNGGGSYPILGSLEQPYLDLGSYVLTGSADSMTVMLTDTGFLGSSMAPSSFISSIGGTTNGQVEVQAWLDTSNTAFGMGTAISSFNSKSKCV